MGLYFGQKLNTKEKSMDNDTDPNKNEAFKDQRERDKASGDKGGDGEIAEGGAGVIDPNADITEQNQDDQTDSGSDDDDDDGDDN